MVKRYRPWCPDETLLFAPSPRDWLPPNHLVYFLLDVMGEIQIPAIETRYGTADPRGNVGYDPRMMTALLVYAYSVGMPSSRRIERATYENIAFRVLCGGQHPDHSRISEFRRENLKELGEVFTRVLALCRKAGLVKLGRVALDGTKVEANASKHKAMSHGRMTRAERELAAEVEAMLAKAETTDREEDREHGPGRRGDELPEELARRESRLERIRQARVCLEAEAAEARARELREAAATVQEEAKRVEGGQRQRAQHRAESAEAKAKTAEEEARRKAAAAGLPEPSFSPKTAEQMPTHQVAHDAAGQPHAKAQRNFTDPDSRIMKRSGEFLQGYNAQAVVDAKEQIIVAHGVSNQAPDAEHLEPMLERVEANCGQRPEALLADAGYWSEANVKVCEARGIDAFIATERQAHGTGPIAVRGRPPKNLDAKGKMRRKLRTKKGRATYAMRKAVVEPVFGQIKSARGFWGFLLRGIEQVRGEWALICAGHNLLKLHRAACRAAA